MTAFDRAYEPGDIFDETAGPGAHLAPGTRGMIRTAYRRWLGFLSGARPGLAPGAPGRAHHASSACGPSSTTSRPKVG